MTHWAHLMGLDWRQFEQLQADMARMAQRPSVQQALQLEAQARIFSIG